MLWSLFRSAQRPDAIETRDRASASDGLLMGYCLDRRIENSPDSFVLVLDGKDHCSRFN